MAEERKVAEERTVVAPGCTQHAVSGRRLVRAVMQGCKGVAGGLTVVLWCRVLTNASGLAGSGGRHVCMAVGTLAVGAVCAGAYSTKPGVYTAT